MKLNVAGMVQGLKNYFQPRDPGPNNWVWFPTRQAGQVVTYDSALTYSAYYAAIKVISESISILPWQTFIREPDGNRRRVANSPIEQMLKRPNDEMSGISFKETMISHALAWGNGYAEITRDRGNRPTELLLITPDRVELKRIDGALVYEITNKSGTKSYIEPANMFHLHGPGFDGLTGYSVATLAARTIGLGLSTEQFGASFFQNGASLGYVIESPAGQKIAEQTKLNILKQFNKKHQGIRNMQKVEMLDSGMQIKEIGIPQKDAQFLESRKFGITDVCRWFRLPPHKLADLENAHFTNIEESNIDFVTDTLTPWVKRLEEEADFKFYGRYSRAYTKIQMNALLRGDSKARAEFYKTMSALGVFSVNDVLELEDRNTIGTLGDKRLVQLNQTTLEKIGEDPEPTPTDTTPPPGQDQTPAEDQTTSQDAEVQNAATCIFKRERARFKNICKDYDDRSFSKWLNTFATEHHNYIIKKLTPAVEKLAIEQSSTWSIDQDKIGNMANYLINQMCAGMNECYARGNYYLHSEKELNAKIEALTDKVMKTSWH